MDGNVVAEKIQSNIAKYAFQKSKCNYLTLATVLIGDDPASKLYIGMKEKCAAAIGIHSKHVELAGRHYACIRHVKKLPSLLMTLTYSWNTGSVTTTKATRHTQDHRSTTTRKRC